MNCNVKAVKVFCSAKFARKPLKSNISATVGWVALTFGRSFHLCLKDALIYSCTIKEMEPLRFSCIFLHTYKHHQIFTLVLKLDKDNQNKQPKQRYFVIYLKSNLKSFYYEKDDSQVENTERLKKCGLFGKIAKRKCFSLKEHGSTA